MKFCGDYHTHTRISSDGLGTIRQNVLAAREKGMTEIAITDHGFRDIFSYTHSKREKGQKEIDAVRAEFPDMRILFGVENSIVGLNGEIDLPFDMEDKSDLNLLGIHFPAVPLNLKTWNQMYMSMLKDKVFAPSKETVERYTKLVISALQKHPIHVLSHINCNLLVNVKDVAQCCYDYGVLIELNCKHVKLLTEDVMEELIASPVGLLADTDAHHPKKVGDFSSVLPLLEKYHLGKEKVQNLNKSVVFPRMNL